MWKGPLASTILAAGVASLLLLGENRVFPAGDIGWLYIAVACFVSVLAIYGAPAAYHRWQRGRSATKPGGALVSFAEACEIANRYIDPGRTMRDSVRIVVRSQILAKFELVVGAKKGDLYDHDLLHQWFQKNAARALVNHQNEIT